MNNKVRISTKKIGEIGEDTACKFLMKHGFSVVDRNYRKKWGEIDVIAKKKDVLHFVEVKTVSCENLDSVIHETNGYKPEDNIHSGKLKRLSRAVQSYLLEKKLDDIEWVFDALAVFLDVEKKKAKVRFTENLVL
jgi:putative endonuclease